MTLSGSIAYLGIFAGMIGLAAGIMFTLRAVKLI
ncbi:MAG: cytochrome b6-f complex subunit 6 [Oscillatoriales cyanobacterium RU_3_3]|nr:cytochrome b6-f complex subunit 6 [Microcoleus sp. SU_5_6]NJM63149.1 cytochrome b6-f complex subunit 6 [Oscillatoriales cyanobacterium RU_3_3]NJR24559.1 cytochrome b6-f complex subunit 6 [Richelia sp. CSU_2_1]